MSFLVALSAMAIAIMFPVFLSLRNAGVAGVGAFAAACGLAALSVGMTALTPLAPPWFNAPLAAMLMMASALAVLSGFRAFLGLPALAPALIGVVLVVASGSLLFVPDGPQNRTHSALMASAMAGAVFAAAAVSILRHGSKGPAIAPHMLVCGVASVMAAIVHFAPLLAAFPGASIGALAAASVLFMPLYFLAVILAVQGKTIAGLRHTIAHDDLTGALSRRAFLATCEDTAAAATLAGHPVAFLLLDIDRFKQINDRHGHAGGDFALVHFTRCIAGSLAGRGAIGRLGGEEFGIIVTGMTEADILVLADELRAVVRGTPARAGPSGDICLTVSIGIAMAEPGGTPMEMMIRADMALYDAKAAGRDRVSLADTLHAASLASARALAGAAAQLRAANPPTPTPSRHGPV